MRIIAHIGTPIAWWHFRRQAVSYDEGLKASDEFGDENTVHVHIRNERDARGRQFTGVEFLPSMPNGRDRDLFEQLSARISS